MNGATALINTLADCGVEFCIANPGTSEMHLVQALDAVPRVKSVLALFEGVCNGAADGILMTVEPNASDKFVWDVAGAAGTNDKGIINTAATAKKGDYVKLRYGSADGWAIKEMGCIWVDES